MNKRTEQNQKERYSLLTWIVKKQVNIANDEFKSMPLKDYINIKWLEIACGEAPYMVSRYDSITGEVIEYQTERAF